MEIWRSNQHIVTLFIIQTRTLRHVEEKFTFILFHSFTFCVFVIMYFDEQAGAQEEKRKIKKDKYLVRV